MTDTTTDEVCFAIEVRVPLRFASAFAAAMTGDDEDIILAAEYVLRDRIPGALGADPAIELMYDSTAARAALREVGEPVSCGCGAVTERECPAAGENYHSSLEQRSDDELRRLRDDDGCGAARLLLERRGARRSP